eukprot:GEMP01035866.1.p1 GENE.GEMP01035866.1~~GEMP01035866.1.p1  ORF type:complete len:369 (+),score=69.83 GEMP01035866.1:411-1517(+)
MMCLVLLPLVVASMPFRNKAHLRGANDCSLKDAETCALTLQCAWDDDTSTCDPKCTSSLGENQCWSISDCFFLVADDVCRPLPSPCSFFRQRRECNGAPLCQWISHEIDVGVTPGSGDCVRQPCATIKSRDACMRSGVCVAVSRGKDRHACIDRVRPCQLSRNYDACTHHDLCAWDSTAKWCIPKTCDMYTTDETGCVQADIMGVERCVVKNGTCTTHDVNCSALPPGRCRKHAQCQLFLGKVCYARGEHPASIPIEQKKAYATPRTSITFVIEFIASLAVLAFLACVTYAVLSRDWEPRGGARERDVTRLGAKAAIVHSLRSEPTREKGASSEPAEQKGEPGSSSEPAEHAAEQSYWSVRTWTQEFW